ncbi:hypothetical protein HAX54_039873 [Datura stramonium]|uniref:C3H1-type domain-containing protein n=1 Tax=Datura stramonium TaxID=4076 RepID=A0ABS8VMJ1_DATST|nr:hypothetical protein [Datura stramonium]
MENWDQETLEKVVASKSQEYYKNKPTDIVCIYFLEAVEKKQYGWFWVCPNGDCHFRHALSPEYILKSQMKALLEEETEKMCNEEEIEDQVIVVSKSATSWTVDSDFITNLLKLAVTSLDGFVIVLDLSGIWKHA